MTLTLLIVSLLGRLRRKARYSTDNCRIYAVGDVHGCFPLLVKLLQMIEQDQQVRYPLETHVVLLGDYIDRGPQSRDVCELLHAMEGSAYFHCLKGNHEETMLRVLEGNRMALRFWLKYGGEETLQSWGIDPALIERAYGSEGAQWDVIEAFQAAVTPSVVNWMRALPAFHRHGDYLFAHAGVRPRLKLEEQSEEDLLWIREPFLSSRARHPWRVVHGHSQSDTAEILHNRIGIDTGAYRSGVLTAVGIEDDDAWPIEAVAG
ncbi:MAG: serine/threonine protein phosphatase [Sphingobium sp.]|nr:serine/threonine protein phosphatase [Sphingobium sp.]MBP8672037.1 serine/threonine protein phosphatase [Sphingobium sp.]MBP9158708.1 serine/threonine protein phosphatase [Sphingobium sp.]